MKFDYSFTDLDDTIFDTRQYKEDIFAVFASSGLSRADFNLAYENAARLAQPNYFHYTYEKQIEAIRDRGFVVDETAVLAQLEKLLDKNYLIADAPDFLKFLKSITTRSLLLTAGTLDFQRKKIDSIGVEVLFDEILQIPGGKDLAIQPYAVEGTRILFINDNLGENILIKSAYPEAVVVTRFNPTYWTVEECAASGIPFFNSLSEIKNYLTSLV